MWLREFYAKRFEVFRLRNFVGRSLDEVERAGLLLRGLWAYPTKSATSPDVMRATGHDDTTGLEVIVRVAAQI